MTRPTAFSGRGRPRNDFERSGAGGGNVDDRRHHVPAAQLQLRALSPDRAVDLDLAGLVGQQGQVVVTVQNWQLPLTAAVDHREFGRERRNIAVVFQGHADNGLPALLDGLSCYGQALRWQGVQLLLTLVVAALPVDIFGDARAAACR